MKEAYEIVKAEELRVGDIVTIEPDLDPWGMDDIRLTGLHLFYRGGGQKTEFSMPRERKIFRQLPPERNPDVLMRALEIAVHAFNALNVITQHGHVPATDQRCIDKAIRELESEAER